ncbi:hypothetical protein [Paracoccus marcusii]|uniref:hypothetical protein n=1 Tax=Paracoccus marcusii TaxID=59779 RepID=UPI003CC77430
MTRVAPTLTVDPQGPRLVLSGDLVVWTLGQLPPQDATGIDLAALARLDTAGAWELARRRAAGTALTGLSARHADLLAAVTAALPVADPPPPALPPGGACCRQRDSGSRARACPWSSWPNIWVAPCPRWRAHCAIRRGFR